MVSSSPPHAAPDAQHRRSPWVAVLLLVALAITLAGIFPFRQMIAQQRQVETAQERLAGLVDENQELEDRIVALNSDAEVERLAREQGLVRPGETGFSMEFEETPDAATPQDEATLLDVDDRSLLGRMWDFLTGRDLDPDE